MGIAEDEILGVWELELMDRKITEGRICYVYFVERVGWRIAWRLSQVVLSREVTRPGRMKARDENEHS